MYILIQTYLTTVVEKNWKRVYREKTNKCMYMGKKNKKVIYAGEKIKTFKRDSAS